MRSRSDMSSDLTYLTDLNTFCVNRMDAHSDHIHFRNEDEARNGVSGFYLCLDGEWDFLYSPDSGKREEEFYREDFSGSKVEKIKVPSHVEMNGYGQIQYINTMYHTSFF